MDPYKILGVDSKCSQDDIKINYKKLALKYHPDKSKSEEREFNENKFKEITSAYKILSDETLRKEYDMKQLFNPDDIFKKFNINLFGNRNKFENIHVPEKIIKINLTLEEIYNGCVKTVEFTRKMLCKGCEGKGFTEKVDCKGCEGKGVIINIIRNGMFFSQVQHVCEKCNKTGFESKKICKDCNDSKCYDETVTKKFSFPKGIPNGAKLNIKGMGDQIKENVFQNIIIIAQEIKHEIFVRKNNKLSVTLNIDFIDTIKYKDFTIKHFDGDIIYNTDEVIDPRKKYIVKEKGINGDDLLITFNVNYCKKEELKK